MTDERYHIINSDTICAPATHPGGAIGIIRISGVDAIAITNRIFKGRHSLLEMQGNTLHFGTVVDEAGAPIDEVLVSIFRAPHSYTGEESTEISCHGSQYILQQVLHTLIQAGCRQANPGEFTQRAYSNGKIDLSQAEAVADLIASTNKATHHLALSQLRGNFSNELSLLRDQLLHITSLLELELDFSDHEELEFADRSELLDLANTISNRIRHLVKSFETGNALKKGIAVAIVGKTNVGKSTLLNLLLNEEKAIVSDIQGTTRDSIEDTTQINGITFRFIDTAGIRHTTDKVEQIGIKRTWKKLQEAAIVLWIVDKQPEQDELQSILQYCADKKLIIIQNKVDSDEAIACQDAHTHIAKQLTALSTPAIDTTNIHFIQISAKHRKNTQQLENLIYQAANIPEIQENDVIVTNARHYSILLQAHDSITRVITGIQSHLSGDLISEDLRMCLDQLAEITGGQITSNEILGNIFKHFCIGK